MIRTKKNVLWDSQKRKSGIVYMDTTKRYESLGAEVDLISSKKPQTLEFELTHYILEQYQRVVTIEEIVYKKNQDGSFELDGQNNKIPIIGSNGDVLKALVQKVETGNILKRVRVEQPIYKRSTFYALFPNLKPEDNDAAMIEQIAYNNALPNNEDNYFWDLTSSDMEVVTTETLRKLLTPVFLDIV